MAEEKKNKVRHFTWIKGASDYVERRVRQWHMSYSTSQGATPVNPRKVNSPDGDPDKAAVITTRWKHNIELSLNEIRWLASTLMEEDDRTGPAKAFQQAYEKHRKYTEQNPSFTGRWAQWYDLSEEEVKYIHNVLQRIKYGRPTPGQEKEKSSEIAKGDW